jgi:methylmalonyl-CoA/ethylmalonyl-CoA epimerase
MMAAADTIEITGVGQIAINCHDLRRATEFYRDTLGLKLLYEFPGLAFFDAGGVRLMLSEPEKPELDHPASIIYYRVHDIQQASRALSEKGIALEHEPRIIAKMPDHDLWMFFVRDSEGNLVGLMSEVRNT